MKIVCYGDSNTWGHNPANGKRFSEKERWPKILEEKLGNEYEIIEEGLCGRTAAFIDDVKPFRYGLGMLEGIIETHMPSDLIIIMLGTNDLKSNFSPNAVAISNGIRKMVQQIRDIYRWSKYEYEPKILILSPIYLGETISTIDCSFEQFGQEGLDLSKKLSKYYKQVADNFDCYFMDASKYAQASNIDCIHMDSKNHEKLASALYDFIKEEF